MGCHLDVTISEENQWTIKGNKCKRGIDYAKSELSNPCRILTTTVRINNGFLKRIPVRTTEAIPKAIIFEAMEAINALSIEAPVKMRTVILHDLLGTGVDVVTSRDMNTYEGL